MIELDTAKNPSKVKEYLKGLYESAKIVLADKLGKLFTFRREISTGIRQEVEKINYFGTENPNHNLRHIKDVVTLVNVFSKEMRLSTYNQIILEVAAWCHDLGHTGMKDKNYMPLVRNYKEEQKVIGREISTKMAVQELKEKQKIDVTEFQPYEVSNISSAIKIFVESINKNVIALGRFTKEFPRAVDQIIAIIAESFHPRFYDPKSETGDWVPTDFGKIFRAADALPCFVWFKYDNENRKVYFDDIIKAEVIESKQITRSDGTIYNDEKLVYLEQSWFEQFVGIYLEEKFSGNRTMYERYVRRKDIVLGLYMETLEQYFARVLDDTEIETASNGQIASGAKFFQNVINFERFYVELLDKKDIPLYIEPAYVFFNEVKPLILRDLDSIEKYVNQHSSK